MYATKPMTKQEIELVRTKSPFAGVMGHRIIGYREDGSTSIEASDESNAARVPDVIFIRVRMPNRKFIYRRIINKPE